MLSGVRKAGRQLIPSFMRSAPDEKDDRSPSGVATLFSTPATDFASHAAQFEAFARQLTELNDAMVVAQGAADALCGALMTVAEKLSPVACTHAGLVQESGDYLNAATLLDLELRTSVNKCLNTTVMTPLRHVLATYTELHARIEERNAALRDYDIASKEFAAMQRRQAATASGVSASAMLGLMGLSANSNVDPAVKAAAESARLAEKQAKLVARLSVSQATASALTDALTSEMTSLAARRKEVAVRLFTGITASHFHFLHGAACCFGATGSPPSRTAVVAAAEPVMGSVAPRYAARGGTPSPTPALASAAAPSTAAPAAGTTLAAASAATASPSSKPSGAPSSASPLRQSSDSSSVSLPRSPRTSPQQPARSSSNTADHEAVLPQSAWITESASGLPLHIRALSSLSQATAQGDPWWDEGSAARSKARVEAAVRREEQRRRAEAAAVHRDVPLSAYKRTASGIGPIGLASSGTGPVGLLSGVSSSSFAIPPPPLPPAPLPETAFALRHPTLVNNSADTTSTVAATSTLPACDAPLTGEHLSDATQSQQQQQQVTLGARIEYPGQQQQQQQQQPFSARAVVLSTPAWLSRIAQCGLTVGDLGRMASVCTSWAGAVSTDPDLWLAAVRHGGVVDTRPCATPQDTARLRMRLWTRALGVDGLPLPVWSLPYQLALARVGNKGTAGGRFASVGGAIFQGISALFGGGIASSGGGGTVAPPLSSVSVVYGAARPATHDEFVALLQLARAESAAGAKADDKADGDMQYGGSGDSHGGISDADTHGGDSAPSCRWSVMIEQDVLRSYAPGIVFGESAAVRRQLLRLSALAAADDEAACESSTTDQQLLQSGGMVGALSHQQRRFQWQHSHASPEQSPRIPQPDRYQRRLLRRGRRSVSLISRLIDRSRVNTTAIGSMQPHHSAAVIVRQSSVPNLIAIAPYLSVPETPLPAMSLTAFLSHHSVHAYDSGNSSSSSNAVETEAPSESGTRAQQIGASVCSSAAPPASGSSVHAMCLDSAAPPSSSATVVKVSPESNSHRRRSAPWLLTTSFSPLPPSIVPSSNAAKAGTAAGVSVLQRDDTAVQVVAEEQQQPSVLLTSWRPAWPEVLPSLPRWVKASSRPAWLTRDTSSRGAVNSSLSSFAVEDDAAPLAAHDAQQGSSSSSEAIHSSPPAASTVAGESPCCDDALVVQRRNELRQILLAIAAAEPALRYTQGMNSIARMLLEVCAAGAGPSSPAATSSATAIHARAASVDASSDGSVPDYVVCAFNLFRGMLHMDNAAFSSAAAAGIYSQIAGLSVLTPSQVSSSSLMRAPVQPADQVSGAITIGSSSNGGGDVATTAEQQQLAQSSQTAMPAASPEPSPSPSPSDGSVARPATTPSSLPSVTSAAGSISTTPATITIAAPRPPPSVPFLGVGSGGVVSTAAQGPRPLGTGLLSLFSHDMTTLRLRLYQADRLILRRFPALHSHMSAESMNTAAYAASWLLTLFSNFAALDGQAVAQVWDRFVLGGWPEVLSTLLSVLDALQPALLCAPMEDMMRVLAAPQAFYAPPPPPAAAAPAAAAHPLSTSATSAAAAAHPASPLSTSTCAVPLTTSTFAAHPSPSTPTSARMSGILLGSVRSGAAVRAAEARELETDFASLPTPGSGGGR